MLNARLLLLAADLTMVSRSQLRVVGRRVTTEIRPRTAEADKTGDDVTDRVKAPSIGQFSTNAVFKARA